MKWLREELFEWSAIVHSKFPADILSAPRRWRHHVFREGKGAFADWTVFVMVEDKHRRPEVYQRYILQLEVLLLIKLVCPPTSNNW